MGFLSELVLPYVTVVNNIMFIRLKEMGEIQSECNN